MFMDEEVKTHAVWVRELAVFLEDCKELKAIRINEQDRKIEIASVGVEQGDLLENYIRETLLVIENKLAHGLASEVRMPGNIVARKEKEGTLLQRKEDVAGHRHWEWREVPWPGNEESQDCHCHHDHDGEWFLLGLLAFICGVGGLVGNGLYGVSATCTAFSYVFYGIAYFAGGFEPMRAVWHKLPKGELDIHFLMLAVALGAASIGGWAEGALLLFLFTFAESLEGYVMSRSKRALDSLFKLAPKTTLILDASGVEHEKPVEEVVVGDRMRVRPGDSFALDAEVVEGSSAADESNLTGESLPVAKTIGDVVLSGTVNLWGVLTAKVVRPAKESSLQKIIRLIQEAQHLKAPSQRFTDKFGTKYTYLVLSATVLMFFVWWLALGVAPFTTGDGTFSAFYRAMTLLVVASPCALVISIPSAILAAIASGARKGVLFKGGVAIEKLADIDVVALDKTGTLTTGDLVVSSVHSYPKGKEREVLEIAYALESNSAHPIARAIVAYGKKQGLQQKQLEQFFSITGSGVQGELDGAKCVLGRRELLQMVPLEGWVGKIPEPSEEFTEVWVLYKDILGCVLLKDHIRSESKAFLAELGSLNVRTVMLTGDRRGTAEAVGREIGLAEVRAGLSPEGKVTAIQEFQKQGHKVAMVGDGVNDAPSLAVADISVAMGIRGSGAALEQSEIVLMNDRIENFLDAYKLSLRAKCIIKQNLAIALGTIVVMVLAASIGIIPLAVGVVAHEGSTALVCLNSLRLLIMRKKRS